MAQPSERQPLLVPRPDDDDDQDSQHSELPQASFTQADRIAAIVLLALTVFTLAAGGYFIDEAKLQVQDDLICRQISPNATYDKHCRDPDGVAAPDLVRESNIIQGWQNYLRLIPGILTAVPYGLAADKYSRRNVLVLSLGGILLSTAGDIIICGFPRVFPLRLVWLSTLVTVIGGGSTVFFALVFAIANDITSIAQKSTVFFILGASTTAGRLLGVYLTPVLTKSDPWLAIYLGLAILCVCTAVALFLPDTRDAAFEARTRHLGHNEDGGRAAHLLSRFKKACKHVGAISRSVVWENKRLGGLLLGALLVTMTRVRVASSAHVAWPPLAILTDSSQAASGEFSLDLVSSFAFTAVLMPAAAQILLRQFDLLALPKDLWLTRVTVVILLVGAILVAIGAGTWAVTSPLIILGVALMAVDDAYLLLTRSLLAILGGEQNIAVLYSFLGVVENVAFLVGTPLLRLLSDWGDDLRDFGKARAIILAVLFAIVGVIVMAIRPRTPETEAAADEEA